MKSPLNEWAKRLFAKTSRLALFPTLFVFLVLLPFLGCSPRIAPLPHSYVESTDQEIMGETPPGQTASHPEQHEDAEILIAENRRRIEALEQELVVLRESVETLRRAHPPSALDRQRNQGSTREHDEGFSTTSVKTASPNATRLYRSAFEAYFFQEDYPSAISQFQEFLTAFPPNDLTDNALYWMGESYYAQGEFERAISSFLKIVDDYPYASQVPEALFKIALSYNQLKNPALEREFLIRVMDNYPFSETAKKAKTRLDELE